MAPDTPTWKWTCPETNMEAAIAVSHADPLNDWEVTGSSDHPLPAESDDSIMVLHRDWTLPSPILHCWVEEWAGEGTGTVDRLKIGKVSCQSGSWAYVDSIVKVNTGQIACSMPSYDSWEDAGHVLPWLWEKIYPLLLQILGHQPKRVCRDKILFYVHVHVTWPKTSEANGWSKQPSN